ncbi:MAG: hypothetical protein LBN74_07360, partial [Prevotella sp.]|nr:hypothetical protein [Prevotella sp.]
MIRRVFVEKKAGYDVEAQGLLRELHENLGATKLESLRIINRYDVSGVSDVTFANAVKTVFAEPN